MRNAEQEKQLHTEEILTRKGNITLVISRPGHGKTGWSIQKLMNVTSGAFHVLAFSFETTQKQFETMGKYNNQETLDHWQIIDQPSLTLEDIEKVIYQQMSHKPIDCVYIDNIDFILTADKRKLEQKSDYHDVILSLKNLCSELDVAFILGKELSDELEVRKNKRPVLKDLKLNKTTKQQIDHVFALYRDEVYTRSAAKSEIIEVIPLKSDSFEEHSFEEYYNIRKPHLPQ